MISAKLCNFFLYGIPGSFLTFLVLFLVTVGISPTKAGIIYAFGALPSLVATPLWGMLVDKTGYRKSIFVVLVFGTILTIFPLPYIAYSITTYESSDSPEVLFYAMLAPVLLSSCFFLPLSGFIDSEVLTLLISNEDSSYGQQRLFGAFGFSAFMLISGIIVDNYVTPQSYSKYTPIFYVYLFTCLFTIPTGICVLSQNSTVRIKTVKTKGIFRKAFNTCKKFDNSVFLVSIVFVGILIGIHRAFSSLYIVNDLKGNNLIVSLMSVSACSAEIAMYIFSHKLIQFINGEIRVIALAVLSWAVRFIILASINNPYLAIPAEVCHSFGFGLFWATVTTHTKSIAADDIATTMISIAHMLNEGLGIFVGTIVAGIVYQNNGGRMLFLYFGISALVLAFILVVYSLYKTKHDRQRDYERINENEIL